MLNFLYYLYRPSGSLCIIMDPLWNDFQKSIVLPGQCFSQNKGEMFSKWLRSGLNYRSQASWKIPSMPTKSGESSLLKGRNKTQQQFPKKLKTKTSRNQNRPNIHPPQLPGFIAMNRNLPSVRPGSPWYYLMPASTSICILYMVDWRQYFSHYIIKRFWGTGANKL